VKPGRPTAGQDTRSCCCCCRCFWHASASVQTRTGALKRETLIFPALSTARIPFSPNPSQLHSGACTRAQGLGTGLCWHLPWEKHPHRRLLGGIRGGGSRQGDGSKIKGGFGALEPAVPVQC